MYKIKSHPYTTKMFFYSELCEEFSEFCDVTTVAY